MTAPCRRSPRRRALFHLPAEELRSAGNKLRDFNSINVDAMQEKLRAQIQIELAGADLFEILVCNRGNRQMGDLIPVLAHEVERA
jgi:hypothetical protein